MNTDGTEYMTDSAHSHIVQVCQSKTAQAELLTHYIKDGFLSNEAVIVIARPGLRKAVLLKLDALGVDIQSYRKQGQIKLFDAEFLLSNILIDDVIDEQNFHKFIGSQIQAAQSEYGKVRAFGEMVDILWQRGLYDTAMQLENIRNDLCMKHELMLLCTYLLDSLDSTAYDASLERICKCHTHSLPIHSFNPEGGEPLLKRFGAAWNSVMDKLTESKNISDHFPSASI